MTAEADYAKLQALQEEQRIIQQKQTLLSSDPSFDITSILDAYKQSTDDDIRDMTLFLTEKRTNIEALKNELGRFLDTAFTHLLSFFVRLQEKNKELTQMNEALSQEIETLSKTDDTFEFFNWF